MKKLSILISVAGVLCAPALQAALQVTLTQNTALYSYGNGGEFRASGSVIAGVNPTLWGYSPATAQGGVGAYFQTFCIETSEYFSPGVAYNSSLNSRAMYGGQFPNGDPISIGPRATCLMEGFGKMRRAPSQRRETRLRIEVRE